MLMHLRTIARPLVSGVALSLAAAGITCGQTVRSAQPTFIDIAAVSQASDNQPTNIATSVLQSDEQDPAAQAPPGSLILADVIASLYRSFPEVLRARQNAP